MLKLGLVLIGAFLVALGFADGDNSFLVLGGAMFLVGIFMTDNNDFRGGHRIS